MITVKQLLNRPHGLFILAGSRREDARPALWDVLAQACDSLYLLGPLSEKPKPAGGAKVWLLECPLEGRPGGLRHIQGFDPHAIHAIGPVDTVLLRGLAEASLSGCVTVAELDATSNEQVLELLRATGIDAFVLATTLVAVTLAGPEGVVTWTLSPSERAVLQSGAPAAQVQGA